MRCSMSGSAPLARRLFGPSRLARAFGELCFHVRQRDPARLEHAQQVVDEVGGFSDQARAILLDSRQHGLDRLLAELLGAMRHALVEEPARVRRVRARLRALLHALFEIAEGEIRHRLCSALAYHLRPPSQIVLQAKDRAASAGRHGPYTAWPRKWYARRNGSTRLRAPRTRGRRGCPRPGAPRCRRRPRRSPAPAPRRRRRGGALCRTLAWCRR